MTAKKFHQLSLVLLFYTLLVILWGAWVRISHSGNGCGDSWPLCQGAFIPSGTEKKTWVEYSHRLTSGLFGLFVIYLYAVARKHFKEYRATFFMATCTLVFTITEALLGAKLVLFGLVGENASMFRAVVMSLHQLNSLLLTGSIALMWIYTSEGKFLIPEQSQFRIKELVRGLPLIFIPIAMTGAWAALSATLFPSESLLQGLQNDFNRHSHFLVQLRVSHPLLAVLLGAWIAFHLWMKSQDELNLIKSRLAAQTSLLVIIGILFGILTLFSLSPVWMKITHLALAHFMWISILRFHSIR